LLAAPNQDTDEKDAYNLRLRVCSSASIFLKT
jgi:hypothetical protein